jgi:hypothetical protein
MTRMCAWCGNKLGQAAPLDDASVTHGICLTCSLRLLKTAGLQNPPPTVPSVCEGECALVSKGE